jgi:hypothetical protein
VAENPHQWTSKYGSLALSAYDMGTHEGGQREGPQRPRLVSGRVEAAFGERDTATIGTAHFDNRSSRLNSGITMAIESPEFTQQVEAMLATDFAMALTVHLIADFDVLLVETRASML